MISNRLSQRRGVSHAPNPPLENLWPAIFSWTRDPPEPLGARWTWKPPSRLRTDPASPWVTREEWFAGLTVPRGATFSVDKNVFIHVWWSGPGSCHRAFPSDPGLTPLSVNVFSSAGRTVPLTHAQLCGRSRKAAGAAWEQGCGRGQRGQGGADADWDWPCGSPVGHVPAPLGHLFPPAARGRGATAKARAQGHPHRTRACLSCSTLTFSSGFCLPGSWGVGCGALRLTLGNHLFLQGTSPPEAQVAFSDFFRPISAPCCGFHNFFLNF